MKIDIDMEQGGIVSRLGPFKEPLLGEVIASAQTMVNIVPIRRPQAAPNRISIGSANPAALVNVLETAKPTARHLNRVPVS